jgi:hypothetical protein
LHLWSYYHRFFESEWEELVSSEENNSNNYSGLEIFKTLLLRPIRFDKTNRTFSKKAINIVLETQTQLKQFQFLKSELEQRFDGYDLIIINPILKSKIEPGTYYVDATQKFNLGVYCRSILHFVFLWLSLSRFKSLCKDAPGKMKMLGFLGKAIYDHLYWRSFFRKYISEGQAQKSCFLAFKGEKYPMRTIMREVALSKRNFVSIQHGFIGAARKYRFANPSVYFVWSDYFKDQLRSSGVKAKIEISGNLQYQGMQKPLPKFKPSGKVIFLPNSGNSTTPEGEVRWATKTYLSISKLSNLPFNISIKPHPGDSRGLAKEEMHKFREENPESVFYWLEPTVKLNFEEYDTVVTMNSTTSIEANLFATPSLILLSNPKEFLLPDLIAYDPSLMVHSDTDLADKLLSIRSDIGVNSKLALENSNKFFGHAVKGSSLICQRLETLING